MHRLIGNNKNFFWRIDRTAELLPEKYNVTRWEAKNQCWHELFPRSRACQPLFDSLQSHTETLDAAFLGFSGISSERMFLLL